MRTEIRHQWRAPADGLTQLRFRRTQSRCRIDETELSGAPSGCGKTRAFQPSSPRPRPGADARPQTVVPRKPKTPRSNSGDMVNAPNAAINSSASNFSAIESVACRGTGEVTPED